MDPKRLLLVAAARRHASTGTGRQIRKDANVSMREIADAIGVSEPTVWRWEEGRNMPRAEAAARWAELLAALEQATPIAA